MLVKYSQLIKNRLVIILLARSKEVTFVLGILSALLGIGFAFGDTSGSNYAPMLAVTTQYVWGILFLVYGGCKIWDALFDYGFKLSSLVSILGIWAWNFVFLSFTYYDTAPVTPTEVLLFLPVICEVWSLIINLYYNSYKGRAS